VIKNLPQFKFTADSPIETAPLPGKVILPLVCYGSEYSPVVKRGENVHTGQEIALSDNPLMPPVLASISGQIAGFNKMIDPFYDSLVPVVTIESDGLDTWRKFEKTDADTADTKSLLEIIRKAGLLGLGGAGFPLYVKLVSAANTGISTLIINGMECEPRVTADYRLMLENAREIIEGINILIQILKPENTVVALDDSYLTAIRSLNQAVLSNAPAGSITLIPLRPAYPGGAEELLVKTICKREIPRGKLPQDVGASVHNVSSVKALGDAVYRGLPFVERVVTVTGKVRQRKNLKVRLGTPVSELLDYCGGLEEGAGTIILGGPMMGRASFGTDVPVNAMLNCIIAAGDAPGNRENPCIRCGRCIEVCPVGLSPVDLFNASRAGKYAECEKARIEVCFECGNCAYICPSEIQLVQYIKVAKREIQLKKAAGAGA